MSNQLQIIDIDDPCQLPNEWFALYSCCSNADEAAWEYRAHYHREPQVIYHLSNPNLFFIGPAEGV